MESFGLFGKLWKDTNCKLASEAKKINIVEAVNKNIYLVCFVFFTQLNAQENLVPNGDFELYKICIDKSRKYDYESMEEYIKYWYIPTLSSPDYFNNCSEYKDFSTPKNSFGIQKPLSGNGYVGLFIKSNDKLSNLREYISVKLKEQLQNDKRYKFTMYVSLTENSVAASNNIGVYFHTDSLHEAIYHKRFKNLPQVTSNTEVLGNVDFNKVLEEKRIINNIEDWVKIEFIYTADGTEKFTTIGNFRTDKQTKSKKNKCPNKEREISSYYFIDDVSLVLIE